MCTKVGRRGKNGFMTVLVDENGGGAPLETKMQMKCPRRAIHLSQALLRWLAGWATCARL